MYKTIPGQIALGFSRDLYLLKLFLLLKRKDLLLGIANTCNFNNQIKLAF